MRYTPPELNGDQALANGDPTPFIDWKKADIWALGVSLYIMLIGIPPPWTWGEGNQEKMVMRDNPWFQYICRNRHLATYINGNLSEEVTNLLQSMLLEDAADRISITDIVCHDWFNEP
jgi:serine/threonine protein kinase